MGKRSYNIGYGKKVGEFLQTQHRTAKAAVKNSVSTARGREPCDGMGNMTAKVNSVYNNPDRPITAQDEQRYEIQELEENLYAYTNDGTERVFDRKDIFG